MTPLLRCAGVVAALLATSLVLPMTMHGQESRGLVTGRVVDRLTGEGISDAVISVLADSNLTRSGAAGRFTLRNVPVGRVILRVIAIGYAPRQLEDVPVGSGRPVQLLIEMEPRALDLADIAVEAQGPLQDLGGATSNASLGRDEIRRAPGVQEDVIRAVSLLPGVGLTTPGRNDLVVRGGSAAENLFLLDGLEIPNINHFGSQGATGGPVSLLPIDLVRGASFSSASPTVAYGDRTASFTAITLREGNEERWASQLNLSATGAGAIVEGPLGAGSVVLGVRRSYLDLLFRALDFSFLPTYWDATLKATQRVSPVDQLSLVALGAWDGIAFRNDDADQRVDNASILGSDQRSAVVGLTWQHALPRGAWTTTLGYTGTNFDSRQVDSLGRALLTARSQERAISLRTEMRLALSPQFEIRTGGVGRLAPWTRYAIALDGQNRRDSLGIPRALAVDTTIAPASLAGYLEGTWRPNDTWRVTAGLRGDHYTAPSTLLHLSPRLGLAWIAAPAITLSTSIGRTVQAPPSIWLIGDPSNPQSLSPWKADQVTVGLAREFASGRLQVEAYYKRYSDYPVRRFRPSAVLAPSGFEDALTDIPFGLEPLGSSGRGTAWGLELLARRQLGAIPVYGLAALTLGRSRFTGLDGVERPGTFDVPVVATLLAGWRPSSRLELSGKVRASSGILTTPFVLDGDLAGTPDFARYLSGPRLPSVWALDLRADRRWSFRRTQLTVYLDIQNVTGRENAVRNEWNLRTRMVELDRSIGRLPSIGVTFDF